MVQKVTEHKEIPARMLEINSFKCDICGTIFRLKYDARRCEKQHGCTHTDRHYELQNRQHESETCDDLLTGIKSWCSNCGKYLGILTLKDYPHDQDLLKAIWELIATHQGIALPIAPSSDST